MNLKGLYGGIYAPLSAKDIENIHDASLTILEKTGFRFEDGLDETIELLVANGATVDRDRSNIFLPRSLVLEQIQKAPEQVTLYNRDGESKLDLTQHRVHLGTGGAAIKILDLESGDARPATLNDLYQLGRLVDVLDNIHFFLRPCIPTDIPTTAYDENCIFACLKGTTKHIMFGVTNEQGFENVFDIASMVAGGAEALKEKPFYSTIACFAISPLKLCTQSTLNMQAAVRHHIPVALSSAPMAGSTSPMTMAGTLAQLHAEEMF
jgi:trimethylamine--corrinoid protein Co-methyltransferase